MDPGGGLIPRTGIGYDVHQFAAPGERPLILGGVEIPSDRGLSGHSDADVLSHAIADAVFGALGEPDIGFWFPPTDPQWRGMCSLDILRRAAARARELGARLVHVDSSLVAESPKVMPHAPAMRAAIGEALGLSARAVGIKATTNEQMGFVGRGEGMAAMAVATVLMPDVEG